MNKRIRPDMVYGNTDLEAIHKKANDIAWKLFEEKKKGSDKLQTRYREHLQKTIDIEGSRYDVSSSVLTHVTYFFHPDKLSQTWASNPG